MECIEARALKSSFLSGTAMKSTQPVFLDDFWCITGFNNVTCDDFSVDDLLDLSDKDFKGGSFLESEEDDEKDSLSFSSQDRAEDDNSNSTTSHVSGDLGPLPAGELAVPVDDLENLEWLSQFVDDSVSELSLLCPAGTCKERTGKYVENRFEPLARPAIQKYSVLCFSSPVPTKSRSKRFRPSESACVFRLRYHMESFGTFGKPAAKKQKKNPAAETGSGLCGSQTQRRCSHCLVQKTPQWRTGPFGPKTLCNACGVRFKSGRLFPEYRPACSPTFSGEIHSNSHRKVLEMRRKKETVEPVETGLTPMVPSF